METGYIVVGIAIMALMTYAIRVSPMIFFRKKIENVRVKSFLYYNIIEIMSTATTP